MHFFGKEQLSWTRLAFLRDVLAKGTDEAIRMHGGRKAILPRSGHGSTVSFHFEAGFQKRALP